MSVRFAPATDTPPFGATPASAVKAKSATFTIRRPPSSSGMPYTPPSHRSPASSTPSSPDASRRSSFHASSPSSRPSLPRSASYATKHRRSPSISVSPIASPPAVNADASTRDITPPGTSDDLQGMLAAHTSPVRQSPPPVADPRTMPPGAILSPPESSSEDEGSPIEMQKRGREIENLSELKEAIKAIPQHRESSPSRGPSPGDLLVLPSQHMSSRIVDAPSKQSLANARLPTLDTTPLLRSTTGRKVSHTRSATEPHIFVSKSSDSAAISDDNSEGDDFFQKPCMVRKKSGELVRPALRPAAHRRPSSVPGTPVFSKAVHFDSKLEHVRHFLRVDRPTAVSATTSPNEQYESDAEYPFPTTGGKGGAGSPTYQWDIAFHHKIPTDSPLRKAMPVRLDKVWLSPDQKSLMGSIAVANLAFQKSVVCRFTFDYWQTVSEVAAEYSRTDTADAGCDQFHFSIKLSDMADLESKTLFFCLRYNVNGLEYWDNNDNSNFQVDFHKKAVPQSGRRSPQVATSGRPANALPRSTRRSSPSTMPRPKSIPMGAFDDELSHLSNQVTGLVDDQDDETGPVRLRQTKSTASLPSDNLTSRLSAPSGQAFGHRYDFGASLSAAVQARKYSKNGNDGRRGSDALYMKPNKKASFSEAPAVGDVPPEKTTEKASSDTTTQSSTVLSIEKKTAIPSKSPAGLGTDSPSSATIASASYEEILNKYCFFGSKQSSPQAKDAGSHNSGKQYEGVHDSYILDSNSVNSSASGSPDMTDRSHRGALHHSLRQNLDLSPFFHNNHSNGIGASPALSPLQTPKSMLHSAITPTPGSPPAGTGSSSPMANYTSLAGISSSEYSASPQPFTPEASSWTTIRG